MRRALLGMMFISYILLTYLFKMISMNELIGCNMLDYYIKLDGMLNLGSFYIDEKSQLHYMI
jgi:hypothetical protein